MKEALKRLKTRPYFLLKYCTLEFLFFCAVVSFLWSLPRTQALMSADFTWTGLYLLPFGLIIGVQVPVLMHNCVHGNAGPAWLNRLAGELAGVYIFLGMEAFALNHVMHHAHADTDMDPHNPYQRNFFKFFFANNFGGVEPVLKTYLKAHGDTPYFRRVFDLTVLMHFLNVPVRAAFWLLLLGPSWFVTFYVPSYLFHMFVFSHINFVTHKTFEDGRVELYNLNSNLYYKFVNFFGSDVYYHKDHHHNPNRYNPKLRPKSHSNALFKAS